MRALFNRVKDRVFRERLTRELAEEMRSHRAMLERDFGSATPPAGSAMPRTIERRRGR